jgi:hypothetical protein
MSRFLFPSVTAILALAGCALSPDWYRAERPPTARALSTQFRQPAYICQPVDDVVLGADGNELVAPQRARQIKHCSPVVVKGFLQSLADRGVRVSCLSISDVDAAGLPAQVDVHCKVTGPQSISQEWLQAYRDVFQSELIETARKERYEPATVATRRAYFAREYPVFNGNAAGFRGFAGIPQEFAQEAAR